MTPKSLQQEIYSFWILLESNSLFYILFLLFWYIYRASCTVHYPDQQTQYIYIYIYIVSVMHFLVWIINFFHCCLCVYVCVCVCVFVCVSTSYLSLQTPAHSDSHFLSLFITSLYSSLFSAAAPQLSVIHFCHGLPSSIFQTVSTRTLYWAVYCLPSLGRDRTA